MKSNFLVLFLCSFILCENGFCQEFGGLNINFDFDEISEGFTFQLNKNDSLIIFDKIDSFTSEWEKDSLEPGVYSIIVFDDVIKIFEFNNIQVKRGQKSYYDFSTSAYFYVENDSTDKFDLATNLFYGNQSISPQPENINNSIYRFEMLSQIFSNPLRHYSFGMLVGGNTSLTTFDDINETYNNKNIISKRYTSLNFCFGVVNRFSTFNMRRYDFEHTGFFIDLGFKYNLPLVFREVKRIDYSTRVQNKFIHNYLDFNAYLSIVFRHIGLVAEYTPTNYLIGNYTQNPKLRLGLNITIPQN